MLFATELDRVLPEDVPHRERLIYVASSHLEKIVAANEFMNLTRITSPVEAAIKHIYDCVAPWALFNGAAKIMDAGTGAGFPGVPLSVIYPETRLLLAESTGKKARFLDGVVDELELANVTVSAERAEAAALTHKPNVITARAMAPLSRIVDLFRRSLDDGTRLLLYKGPDMEGEIAQLAQSRYHARVAYRYELPENMGSRTIVEIKA